MTDPSPDTWRRLASRRLVTHEVRRSGLSRSALLYVPQHVRRRGGLPLVVLLHGGASSPETIARRSALHVLAEREGFVVAYPRGIAGLHGFTWNPAGNKQARKFNDAGFVRDLIGDIEHRYEIDADRIYLAGFSIGGSLVYELACSMAERIAAFAVVSGTMISSHCVPARPVPLLHIHGTADRRVPFDGGRGPATQRLGEWTPVRTGIDRWRAINACASEAIVVEHQDEGVTGFFYSGAADVELWLIAGGTHVWPGAKHETAPGETPAPAGAFSATTTIWRFFAGRPRRRREPAPTTAGESVLEP